MKWTDFAADGKDAEKSREIRQIALDFRGWRHNPIPYLKGENERAIMHRPVPMCSKQAILERRSKELADSTGFSQIAIVTFVLAGRARYPRTQVTF